MNMRNSDYREIFDVNFVLPEIMTCSHEILPNGDIKWKKCTTQKGTIKNQTAKQQA